MANAKQVEVLFHGNPIFRLNVIALQKLRHLINKDRFIFAVNREATSLNTDTLMDIGGSDGNGAF
jgi:hypothetical protein